ncbi:MAG TPA: aspartate aminotransferase family protein [Planctomycetes bacterium]|nr:aspartate aminotransferase family protein [Planctomycetota bacterium]
MTFEEIKAVFDRYVTPNYSRLPIAVVKAEGSFFHDVEGKKYIDLFPGWGVSSVGYCHKTVVSAVKSQAAKLLHVPNNFYIPEQGLLAQAIVERAFPGKVFFCNSGAEAVESALKLARIHGRNRRYKIVSMENSFHGRTMGALSATGQEKYQREFRPLVPGFTSVPFNDLGAASAAIDDETAAVIVEPVQGEGGVNVAAQDYVAGLRRITRERDVLLIFDEVQTGFGRTGEWFAFKHYGVEPDIMCMAKAIGGGMPMGAILAGEKTADLLTPGTHASTFGGNSIACAAALAVIKVIEKEKLLARGKKLGEKLSARFAEWQKRFPMVKETRGLGAMWGVELAVEGKPVVDACLKKGVNINCTHGTVLRMLPALNVSDETLEEGLRVVEEAMSETLRE